MIIRRLVLHNFGVFAGTNSLDLSGSKPVVLIGGKNGRGKTSILEAVLLSLYGSNSFAYSESKFSTYGQYLKSYVNKVDGSLETFVEMEFSTGSDATDVFCVRREWDGKSQRTHEKIIVKRNGDTDDFLTENWGIFIENLLPSALSSFFFFDGEKISELAVDDTSEQVKESIKAMLGITVLDVLESDLGRIVSKISKYDSDNSVFRELDILRDKKEKAEAKLNEIDQKIVDIKRAIEKTQNELEKLNADYSVRGGGILEQRNELLQKRGEELALIKSYQEQLIDVASGELPLALVRDLVDQISQEAQLENEKKLDSIAIERINETYKKYTSHSKELESFIKFLRRSYSNKSADNKYNLSESCLLQLNSLRHDMLEQNKEKAKDIIKMRNKHQKKIDEIDNSLSIDIDEKNLRDLLKRIKKKEGILFDNKVDLEIVQKERIAAHGELLAVESEYSKLAEKTISLFETSDSEQRIAKYAHMAIAIIQNYRIKLQERKIDVLARTMTTCYKKLANKKNLVDSITIDVNNLDFHYLNRDGDEIAKKRLSAGEKQLMVVSLLWALAICSQKKLPVIIDTPLSRLDSSHRTALVKTYFPHASDQTIILSTDSEIDEKYYGMIKKNVGDEYTLKYDDKTRTARIVTGYFGW